MIVTKDIEARDRLRAKLEQHIATEFPGTDAFVHLLDIGPPVGRPVQYRVSGPDMLKVRSISQELAAMVGENQYVKSVVYDWNEPGRVIKIDVLQDKAAQLGITSQSIAQMLNSIVGGTSFTQIRDHIYLVNVIGRAMDSERTSIETLQNLQIANQNGQTFPLAAIANIRYEIEQPAVWRRSRLPTLTIKSSISSLVQPATVVAQLEKQVEAFAKQLPAGYSIATVGQSKKVRRDKDRSRPSCH